MFNERAAVKAVGEASMQDFEEYIFILNICEF